MNKPTCVICEGPCGDHEENPLYPFCSRRCQLIDLGHWLDGDYRIPSDTDPQSSDSGPGGGALM